MAQRANTIAQGFSNKVMKALYDKNLIDSIVNRDYEGEINAVGSKLNILDLDKISEKTYTNSPLSADSLTENNGALVIDQYKSFYWKEKTLDNWLSYIKDPHPTIVEQVANERSKNMDSFVLGKYASIGAGNRVGTDYTTGTVSIDSAGNVTGSGTTFTSSMVGRGFKATGHTKWYRVKTFSSTTAIVIEDDLDDVTSQYTGGVINASATFTIEASTALALTTSTLLTQVAQLKLKLDKAEANGYHAVPDENRFLIVPPEFEDLVVRSSGIVLHVPEVYDDLIQKGMIGELLGFKLFRSNRLAGDNTNGYRVIAGQSGWMTFAEKVLQARIEEDLIGDFGAAFKDLFVYGAKVKDARRHFAAEGYFTFTL
jgi:hypothetical protein